MISKERKKDQSKATTEPSQEEKSEEFLNFERGLDHILSLSKKDVEEVKKAAPVPRRKRKRN